MLLLLGDRFVPNNSIITFSDIEDTSSNGLFCITNYTNCCRRKDGSSDGRWHFPDSADVTLQSATRFTYMVRGPSKVVLRRVSGSSNSPAGIYRCEILIDHSLRASFYVGIYATNAGAWSFSFLKQLNIHSDIAFDKQYIVVVYLICITFAYVVIEASAWIFLIATV